LILNKSLQKLTFFENLKSNEIIEFSASLGFPCIKKKKIKKKKKKKKKKRKEGKNEREKKKLM